MSYLFTKKVVHVPKYHAIKAYKVVDVKLHWFVSRHYMEVSVRLHAPASLTSVCNGWEVEWMSQLVQTYELLENLSGMKSTLAYISRRIFRISLAFHANATVISCN